MGVDYELFCATLCTRSVLLVIHSLGYILMIKVGLPGHCTFHDGACFLPESDGLNRKEKKLCPVFIDVHLYVYLLHRTIVSAIPWGIYDGIIMHLNQCWKLVIIWQ